jgi:glycosyltransferase involved in cell wall biosynthesis
MHIWLITIGEPLPTDNTKSRLLRTGILANLLVEKGHQVIWWTSTFDHTQKKHRFNEDTYIRIKDTFKINLLHSLGYKSNISLTRILDHTRIAQKFKKLSEAEPKPDIILCSLPTLELSLAATEYGRKKHIPVILDVRDLWPDIFVELAPKWMQGVTKLLLLPMFNTVRSACTKSTAISGITSAFVDWGVNYANRERSELDRDFPLGYSEVTPTKEAIEAAEKFWHQQGIRPRNNEFIACFFGTIGHQFELETVIQSAKKLAQINRPIRFVLCGRGDNLTFYQDLARGCNNIIFPGWVGASEIWTLMRMSSIGLAPYRNRKDFCASLPNKSIEYLSAGLPIVSSLQGTLENLLSNYNCGITYDNNDPDNLASILINLYECPEQLQILSQNASTLYKGMFVAEKVYENMIDYLKLVCQSINPTRTCQ